LHLVGDLFELKETGVSSDSCSYDKTEQDRQRSVT